MIPLLRLNYSDEEITWITDNFQEVLKSGQLTMHNKVRQFEDAFQLWNRSKFAIATNSGTSSIEIPLRAIGVENKVVLCPSNTYMATPLAAIHAGAKVCFLDTDFNTLQISYESFLHAVNCVDDIKCLIVVHIAGNISSDLEKILEECAYRGITVIEDAAHAHGSEFKGKKVGNFGLAGSFSFYPTKVLNAAEGGMIVTESDSIYETAISLREHGKITGGLNIHDRLGYNWRFSEFHAVLGIQQMIKADNILQERRELAAYYTQLLDGVEGIKSLSIDPRVNSSFYKFVLFLDESISRNNIKKSLKDGFNISLTGEVYSHPCHSQPVFKQRSDLIVSARGQSFESTDAAAKQHICLPLYPGLKKVEQEYVVDCLKKLL